MFSTVSYIDIDTTVLGPTSEWILRTQPLARLMSYVLDMALKSFILPSGTVQTVVELAAGMAMVVEIGEIGEIGRVGCVPGAVGRAAGRAAGREGGGCGRWGWARGERKGPPGRS